MNLVYSTESGKICKVCKKPQAECICKKKKKDLIQNINIPNDGIIRLLKESKGRKGKGVTLVAGIDKNEDELKKIAKLLKQKCGSGGTVKNHIIEIQTDNREVLKQELEKMGFKVKISGG
ncbi:MAG: stress response translation initiation inhibitor YciH [Desulforegulaceae bacterium]|nr:stress response translation initiation inhibitor YciH [Desulforegulaceae bacterium]